MAFKPMDVGDYLAYLKAVGWKLKKGSIDDKLFNEKDEFLCQIKIAHGKRSKKEVIAPSVKKTENEFKKRDGNGLQKRNNQTFKNRSSRDRGN